MSHSTAANHSADASFAGLLAQLTRDIGPEESGTSSPRQYAPATASSALRKKPPASTAKQAHRTPIPPIESNGRRATGQCAEISYEKALQLHRRRTTPEIDWVKSAQQAIVPSSVDPTDSDLRKQQTLPEIRQSKNAKKEAALKTARAIEGSQPRQRNTVELPDRSEPMTGISEAWPLPGQRKSAAVSAASKTDAAAGNYPAVSRAKAASKPGSSSRTRHKSPTGVPSPYSDGALPRTGADRPQTTSVPGDTLRTSRPAGLAVRARSQRPSNLSDLSSNSSCGLSSDLSIGRLIQKEQRKTIVSLRLSDGELEKLKDRAGESGISISAYMRLCVLDADELRTQVKQALAALRSLSTGHETHATHTLAVATDHSTGNGIPWLGEFLRSAALLFRPLFSFRRSA